MLNLDNCSLIVIDIQEKLVNAVSEGEICVKNAAKLVKAANILNIPTVITEQYPKGLGKTVEEIETKQQTVFEKSAFSALYHSEIKEYIKSLDKKQMIICGIEAHICVLQTAEDLINNGYEVFMINDASSSRSEINYNSAIEYAKQIGIKVISTEIALFQLLKTSKHPNFKEVQALIK